MAKILFVSRPAKVRFRELDYQILSREHTVTNFGFKFTPLSVLSLFVHMRKNDIVFCWFAGLWSFFCIFFAKLLKKKSIVVPGGFDVANVPKYNYGLTNSPFHRWYVKYILNNCDLALPITKANYEEVLAITKPKKCTMVYCGVELKPSARQLTKKKQVLTVGIVNKDSSHRKGHFRFIETAKYLPDIPFILVGRQVDNTIDKLKANAPPNVTFYDFLNDEELYNLFAQSKVYMQLSYHESFGLSVVEAMSMGSTVIVSDNPALAEVVADTGIVVDIDDYKGIAAKTMQVFESRPDYNEKAAERALQFDIKIRERKLLDEVDAMISASDGKK
jgi:glycosyltransferase involved in cell wall biosynthesis